MKRKITAVIISAFAVLGIAAASGAAGAAASTASAPAMHYDG